MKKLKITTVFVICLFIISTSLRANSFRTGFNNYQIKSIENVNPQGSMEKSWNITYNQGNNPITVVKHKVDGEVVYLVNSKFFEVCYACSSKGFGTVKVKKSLSTVPWEINHAVLNTDEIKGQAIITPEQVNDDEALGLIASYLPNLINDEYTHLLN